MIPSRLLATLSLAVLLAPALTLAQEEPVAGQETFRKFTDSIKSIPKTLPSLAVPYSQPQWSLNVPHPDNWLSQERTKTTTKLNTIFYPMASNTKVDGVIGLIAIKKSVPQSVESLEKSFDDRAYMAGGTESIGDWFIPSMSNLERSDAIIAGLKGRQFMYTTYREGEHYIGISRMFFVGNTIYDFYMFVPPMYASKVYWIYDQMSQNLTVGSTQSSSSSRALPNVRNSRIKSSSSVSSRSAVACRPTRTKVCAKSASSRSMKSSISSTSTKASSSSSSRRGR